VTDVANQPFYHLRPNKNIDRHLFLQTLIGLSRQLPISDYSYTGFGSYLFDDFKLLHEILGISKMISLEQDPYVFKRAKFNLPYNCIEVKNISSTDYISDLSCNENDHNIFWLDFVAPSKLGEQLADYSSLLTQLNPYDIIRITLNANPNSLGGSNDKEHLHAIRFQTLKTRVQSTDFPSALTQDDVTTKRYPLALLQILKLITTNLLRDMSPYSPNFMFPLFSTIYADGQQMVTFTGIVLDNHKEEDSIKNVLNIYPHNTFTWDTPHHIEIPSLTVRELMEINKLLPSPNAQQQLMEDFPFIFPAEDPQSIDNYIQYYKYYPNYHQVNF
jgi:hypothetical protein